MFSSEENYRNIIISVSTIGAIGYIERKNNLCVTIILSVTNIY